MGVAIGIVIVWLVCFIFAWGYAWRNLSELHDSPPMVCGVFIMVLIFAPLIVIAVPLGRLAIKVSEKVYKP